MMQQIRLSRNTAMAIAAMFVLLLTAGFLWKMNPLSGQRREQYYKDAARVQAEEANLPDAPGQPVVAPIASDKAYQPETGNID
jgi:hypothetical protein